MKLRAMPAMKMATPGHYRPPRATRAGAYNKPRVGRVGKQQPSFKQSRPMRPLPRPR